jgi:hypothetical protein
VLNEGLINAIRMINETIATEALLYVCDHGGLLHLRGVVMEVLCVLGGNFDWSEFFCFS